MIRYGFKPFFDAFRSWLMKKMKSDPTILKAAEQYSNELVVAAKSHLGLKVDRIPRDPKSSLALGYMIGIGFSFSFTAFSFYQTQHGFDQVRDDLKDFKDHVKYDLTAFKDDLTAVKDDLKDFKDDVKHDLTAFKDYLNDIKDDLKDFKNDLTAVKDDLKDFHMTLDEFKGELKRAVDHRSDIISTEIKSFMRTMLKAAEE